MDTVLYPWTKPEALLDENKFSWNTEPDNGHDGTLRDWFEAFEKDLLPYEYDHPVKVEPLPHKFEFAISGVDEAEKERFRISAIVDARVRGGDFKLKLVDKTIAELSILSAFGFIGCARCASKAHRISFLVNNHSLHPYKDFEEARPYLTLTKNHMDVQVLDWEKSEGD